MNKKVLRLFVLTLGLSVLVGCGSDTQNIEPTKGSDAVSYRLLEGSRIPITVCNIAKRNGCCGEK